MKTVNSRIEGRVTLMELLVVLAIIVLMIIVAIPSYVRARKNYEKQLQAQDTNIVQKTLPAK